MCGCYNLDGFIRVTHALSLNDTFWIKTVDSKLQWKNVSLYENQFDETIAKIAFEGGLYGKELRPLHRNLVRQVVCNVG